MTSALFPSDGLGRLAENVIPIDPVSYLVNLLGQEPRTEAEIRTVAAELDADCYRYLMEEAPCH